MDDFKIIYLEQFHVLYSFNTMLKTKKKTLYEDISIRLREKFYFYYQPTALNVSNLFS